MNGRRLKELTWDRRDMREKLVLRCHGRVTNKRWRWKQNRKKIASGVNPNIMIVQFKWLTHYTRKVPLGKI